MSNSFLSRRSAAAAAAALIAIPALAATPLADQPVFSAVTVPGNLALALSVEFPTAVGNAHIDATYNPASTYLGYFDPNKCYDYRLADSNGIAIDHFAPTAKAANHTCSRKWSGNFLNWAATQTIDPFRWALTGGFRVLDTTSVTVLQKANATGQGGTGNFPDRNITTTSVIAGATPLVDVDNRNNAFTWTSLKIRIQGMGRQMRFSGSGNNNSGNPSGFNPASSSWAMGTSFVVNVNAKVCDSTLGVDYLESNCKKYGTNYKPEGLIQQYANQIRFSAFGYLNDGDLNRDGAVLRASQKFVGPKRPVPGGTDEDNDYPEWNATTGVMIPDASPNDKDNGATVAAFGTISNSGVMNYLNKFGATGSYKTYDPVGELYYATLRYFRNLGNVSTWSAPNTSNADTAKAYADGFPVVATWKDPILYQCQKNFVLGIGDVNTHADRNLPGSTGNSEPAKPREVSDDTAVNATTFTNYVGTMSGINNLAGQQPYNGCCTNNGALMAGLAYWANSTDIRPDMDGKQTVQTYWVDVLELQTYKNNNQYFLATKYGGANLPSTFDPTTRSADLLQSWWHTGDSSDTVGNQLRPDTYFTAGKPDSMVAGLASAFSSIASRMKANSTALATTSRSIGAAGTANYVGQFDAGSWSGEIVARQVGIDPVTNALTSNDIWSFSKKLEVQLAGNAWKSYAAVGNTSGRFMATYNTTSRRVVPFTYDKISSDQKTALNTTYGKDDDGSAYLDYLRGDRKNEQNSVVDGSLKAYRNRVSLVGDIVNSKVLAIGAPAAPLSEATNPGYAAFKAAKADRRTILVTGTNAGVVHVIDGSLTASARPLREPGKELFAYVPGDTYVGPNGNAAADGLQWVGNPAFNHRFLVDGPLSTMDVDFNRTNGNKTGDPDWRTLVVGGLGKGGRSIYALDLTDVDGITSDDLAASKVLWEFSGTDMGFQFGEPLIAKVERYGWVVMVPAGHNNTVSGRNHLFILDAKTGTQLAVIDTPVAIPANPTTDAGTTTSPSGMSTISAYYSDISSLQAESVYGGDLTGAVWRFDLRGSDANVAFPAPVKIAQAADAQGNPEPITTRTLVVVQPNTNRRWVAFGTGKLLAASDLNNTQGQRLYAVIDGNSGRFNTAAQLPTGVSFPISPNNLQRLTDLTQQTVVDYQTKSGWYVDVVAGYRVVVDPTYAGGTVAYAATLPNNSNPCNPSGSSIVYAIDLGTGRSQLSQNAAYITPGFAVTDLQFVQVPPFGGTALAIGGAGDSDSTNPPPGDPDCPPGTQTVNGPLGIRCVKPPAGLGNRLLNWREVPLRSATGGIQ